MNEIAINEYHNKSQNIFKALYILGQNMWFPWHVIFSPCLPYSSLESKRLNMLFRPESRPYLSDPDHSPYSIHQVPQIIRAKSTKLHTISLLFKNQNNFSSKSLFIFFLSYYPISWNYSKKFLLLPSQFQSK